MKRITVGLVLLAIFAGMAHAQSKEEQEEKKREEANPLLREYHEQQKRNAAVEQQYQRTLRATDRNAVPARVDPWANMRGSDASKPKR